MAQANPYEKLPRTGPYVQNVGGLAPNTAPMANRPPAQPGINTGPVGRPMTSFAPTGSPVAPGTVPPPPTPSAAAPPPAAPPPAAAPAPSAAAPPSPAAAPAPASGGMYGRGGGGLEEQLRSFITGGLEGGTSEAFLNSAKNQLSSAVQGQRGVAERRIDDDAIRRGVFRSGIPSEQRAAAGTAAQGAFAKGLADILGGAEDRNAQVRSNSAGMAQSLLGMNRDWDAQEMARAEAAAARAAANRPSTFMYEDPDTGETYEMDESWF
jgi:hypothetical protein